MFLIHLWAKQSFFYHIINTLNTTSTSSSIPSTSSAASQPQVKEIEGIFSFVETHPVLMGIITGILGFVIGGAFLWRYKARKEQQSKAIPDFYVHLETQLVLLENTFNKCSPNSNPFCLLYSDFVEATENISFPYGGREKCIEQYKDISRKIIETVDSSDNNIFPRQKTKDKWYKSINSVYGFAQFIVTEKGMRETKTLSRIHIEKWNDLKTAVYFLLSEIKRAI